MARATPEYEPFTLGDFNDDTPIISNGRLEGPPPRTVTSDGDRSCTLTFLIQFKRFMLMNNDAKIARSPLKRSTYFLLLIGGSKVG